MVVKSKTEWPYTKRGGRQQASSKEGHSSSIEAARQVTKNPLQKKVNLPMDVLRSFVAIADYGGFTQAGERLGRSQAAISLQIKKLESLIDSQLFIRKGHRFVLSPAGEKLLSHARQILALNDRAVVDMDNSSIGGKVRLGIPSEFATTLLPRIVGRFSTENPNVTLEVNCDLSKNLLTDIQKDRYDLVLGLHGNPSDAGANLIRADRLVWVSGRDFDINLHNQIPMIVAPEGCLYRSTAVTKLQEQAQHWRILYTIQDLSGIKSAIEEGLGVTVLAESTVPKTLNVMKDHERLPNLGKIGISLIVHSSKPGEACLALQAHIEQALSEKSPMMAP